uniref:B30.2/SPRY domain-containing protein n=1 Tax=Gadus morhua TaxID=8049 RepID=A0A8C5F441_GADMO
CPLSPGLTSMYYYGSIHVAKFKWQCNLQFNKSLHYQYEVDVTLDPDTAHPKLILSEDGKQVHCGGVAKVLPDNPKRFTKYTLVLTRQSFSSGRFYFEVQVKDKTAWWLGVVRESIDRKCETTWTPETGYWTLFYYKDSFVFIDNPPLCLPLRAELQKVGVFVDYDEGLVSFYDVEARDHIYSATETTKTTNVVY